MKIKHSAIIYTGYEYQTLQGIKLLAEWLHSPNKYSRVSFEADADNNETPEGIDDIVCERPNGIKDFWQVKFTPSPYKEENHLTWDWLLNVSGKTARSRSILKKIYDAIISVPTEKLGEVVLLTNKFPDRLMEYCLNGSKVDFEKIDDDTRIKITEQLGNVEAAESLFSRLSVQHSDGDYTTTKRFIRNELLKFSDDAGIERLVARAREWAMFKNNPPEDGWIHLYHIRAVLSTKRPEPIPEIFTVPDDYCLPDVEFHENLMVEIASSKGAVITLTGKPGVGKSTYLSYLCQDLETKGIPLIRHHYFLSLGDTTEDRLSPRIVAESLLHQINNFHKESNADTSKPEKLRDAILTCANYYKDKGKPFVVLVDGLDHVWRDNARNKKPLDETFRQLLPTINNLIIIVGTQPVDDELLPDTLITHSSKKEWFWLPEMTGNSIYDFLKNHIASERLIMKCHDNQVEEEIRNCASALLDITNGYPLHVIYSSEYLSQNGLPLSSWQIEKLPSCTDGNIITYYSELWRNLNYRQKDVLHLCSGFQFAWPRQAIGTIIKDNHEYAPSVDAVAHMLSEGFCGLRPFHESLVVFIKNQKEHQERINSLLPSVCDWLKNCAPVHLKDNWLWSSLARAGDSTELREGVTRDWILDKLVNGMPIKSCIRLLSEAETYAFDALEYAEAYKHRELKTRLINGPEFQIWDPINLEVLSLVSSTEPALNEIISGKNEYSPVKLSILAIALWHRGDLYQANRLSKKAIDRYRAKNKLLSSRHSQDHESEAVTVIKAGVLTDSLNYDAIFEGENFSNWPDGFVASFRHACCTKKDLSLLLRAWHYLPSNSHHKSQIELDAIRLSIIEGADITCRPEYKSFSSQHLSGFFDAFSKKKFIRISTHVFEGQSSTTSKIEVVSSYHNWFFSSLNMRLNAEGDYSWLPVSAISDRIDVSAHYELLNEIADWIADVICAEGALNFDIACSLFPVGPVLDDIQWETRRTDISLRRSWIEIAADLHLITTKTEVSRDELKRIVDDGVFNINWLRLWYKESGLKLLKDNASELLIDLEEVRQMSELEETIENTNNNLELAQIAFQHENLASFQKLLRKTWDFVLGYGHHKDPTIFDVVNAVSFISYEDPDSALTILERISPIVYNISKFTDGDETRNSKHSLTSILARLNPQTAASVYEQELCDGEWYYSEDTILRLIERCDFSEPIIKNLYLTGLHSSCLQMLLNKVESGNPYAIQIAGELEKLLGKKIQMLNDDKHSSNDVLDEKIVLNISDYPPDSFDELIVDLKGNYSTHKFLVSWYKYWCDQGKENELLHILTSRISTFTDRFDDKRYLLDLLFSSSFKLEGKSRAFKILVAAHRSMGGWSDWYEREENSINRLKIVAEQYPQKIEEFIKLTTLQPDDWNDKFGKLIIPNDKLVFLLSHSGRKEEALKLTLQMVKSLEDSVRNLQLTKPIWDWHRNDSLEEALLKSLVSRLKLPIPTIKIWVMEQLSQLLIAQNPKVEDLLKIDLASRKQESECVEVLSVFFIEKSKGYVCDNEIGKFIKARSSLSDLMITELVSNANYFGEYASQFNPFIVLDGDNNRFEYYQGNHVPLLYNSLLDEQEKKTGVPFTGYYQSEWNRTFEYQPSKVTSIDYFLSGDRQRSTGQFYTQASHRGRSAYLRTLEVAKNFFGMPNDYAQNLSVPALPIEPAYLGIVPKKPTWIPEWKAGDLITKQNLIKFVEELLMNFDTEDDCLDLLAISFPIKLDENRWVDLTIVKALAKFNSTAEIKVKERIGCISIGNLLNNKLLYELYGNVNYEGTVLAVTPFPLTRYGHWHSDLETRGIYIPMCTVDGKKTIGYSANGLFCYDVDNARIGFSSFWYNYWQPIHPKGINSLCGSYTAVIRENIEKWINTAIISQKSFYACKAVVLTSDSDYKEYDQQVIEFDVL